MLMRATIDIPDPLFREVKETAEHEQKVSEFLCGIQARNTVPMPALNRDELHDRR
jgi:hypothetical protein